MKGGCNQIPVLGWMWSFGLSVSMSVPFWLGWTHLGMGAKYAPWLPSVYLTPPFWDCVWVFILVSILKSVFLPSFNVSSKSESKGGQDE